MFMSFFAKNYIKLYIDMFVMIIKSVLRGEHLK